MSTTSTTSTSTTSTSTTSTSTTSTTSTTTSLAPHLTIGDVLRRIRTNLQDKAELLEIDDHETYIQKAKISYDRDRPYIKIKTETGDGSTFQFDLPSDWEVGFSQIYGQIEYPVDVDVYQQIQLVDDNDWVIYRDATDTEKLRLTGFTPASSAILKYKYSIAHVIDQEACTIYERDLGAFSDLATAFCFKALAAYYTQTIESTYSADSIDYLSKRDECEALANTYLDFYNSHMGKGVKGGTSEIAPSAGMAFKDLDLTFPCGGDYLTHPSRQR